MKKILSLFFAFSIILSTSTVFSQIYEVNFNARVAQSQLIIEGKVISKTSFWDANQYNIYTAHKVEVYKVFKGNLSTTIVEVITPGGTVGYHKETVEPSLSLSVNEIGIFMLKNSTIAQLTTTVIPQFEPNASTQGFVKYDLNVNKAVGPFDSFNDIENVLYPAIQNLTSTPYSIVSPFSTKIKGSTITNKAASISNFAPTTATAGTATTITINGSGFGSSAGTVRFSSADDGGATFVDGLATEIISWNDAQIVVEVYQEAGTGPIQVVGTSTASSSQTLTVSYAQLNAEFDPGTGGGTESYQTRHVDRDGSGGYVWQMQTDFDASAANAAFIRSLESWRCNTGINWTIGSVTTTDVVANDNINIIRMDNGGELPGGVLGRCTSRWSGCGGATIEWYVEELDIVFDDATNWNYSTSAPGFTEYDFESVSVHELGHGHQLGHVINGTDVMHFSISNGSQKRTPSANNIAGASDVQSRSTGGAVCSQTVMTSYSCGSAPVADFAGAPTVLCEGSTVSFFDGSTPLPTGFVWSFTGGTPNSSTAQNPVITYNTAGVYTVTLTASNAFGSDVETKVGYITVNALPDLSSTNSTAETCTTNDGTATVTPSPVGTYTYLWDVTTGNQTTQTATGLVEGTYNVTVTNTATTCFASTNVVVANGCVPCTDPDVPTLSVSPTICSGNSTNLIVTAGNLNDATDWEWYSVSCGGTGEGNGTSINVSPTTTTTYFVRGEGGCITPGTCASVTVTVNNAPGAAGPITGSTSECENTTAIPYSISAVPGATSYVWAIPVGATVASGQGTTSITVNFGTTSGNVSVTPNNSCGNGGSGVKLVTISNCVTPPTINPYFCGTIMSQVNQQVYSIVISGATQYEFQLVPQGGGATLNYVSCCSFRLNFAWFSGWDYNTTYDVSVRAKVGGTFTAYGSSCPITSPPIIAPTIRSGHCGTVMTQVNQQVYATEVTGATEYEFQLVPQGGGTTLNYVSCCSFRLNFAWFSGWSINTVYDVSVRAKVNGSYSAYGTSCPVTSPPSLLARVGFFKENEMIPEQSNLELKIYPNPSRGEFVYMELQGISLNSKIIVTDIFGKTILNQPIETDYENYLGTLKFDQTLTAGFYMITVISGDQKITKKLIVR